MKHLWIASVACSIAMVLPLQADDQKNMARASAVMDTITAGIRAGNVAAVRACFETRVMVTQNEGFARMFKADTDYDGFGRNSGVLYAVFFDTMKMRAALRPFTNTDDLYCLRDVVSRGEVVQLVVNPEDGAYQICGVYKERSYSIHLRKNGDQYKVIIVSFAQRKKK